jgi:anti-anti-sigma factor
MVLSTDRHVRAKNEQGVLVLTITDREVREYEAVKELGQELHDAIARSPVRKVALDFALVRFTSSVAFWPVIFLNRKLREMGGRVILCNMTPTIKRVFEQTRLLVDSRSPTGLFEYAPDLATVIARLNRSDGLMSTPRSHAPRGNAAPAALRPWPRS